MNLVGILNLNALKKYIDYIFIDFQISLNSSKIIKILYIIYYYLHPPAYLNILASYRTSFSTQFISLLSWLNGTYPKNWKFVVPVEAKYFENICVVQITPDLPTYMVYQYI